MMHAQDIDFVIIGAAKCATTWLQKSLQSDPAVSMPNPELHYFSRNYEMGDRWYLEQFPDRESVEIVGEKSNSYLDTPAAPMRLYQLLPHAKLVVQLRNPVERAYSDYCMLYRRGDVDGDIEAHLDPRRGPGRRPLVGGLYHRQLQAYLDLFPKERLLVLFYEDMLAAPTEQIGRLREFLGLPVTSPALTLPQKVKDRTEPMMPPHLRKWVRPLKPLMRSLRGTRLFNAARGAVVREIAYPPMTQTMRQRLAGFYEEDVTDLGNFVQRDLSQWLSPEQAYTHLKLNRRAN
ncbi:sulfotransferase [Aureimonas sp. SA4125]|uniref:sulfotransferase family protein n=1 Tax=Aureimonas sp. SA4125 TaxID=2826993 RepID=UPI001CC74220|nr:sulfotransferase [Aureimonas sp. SA4125]BDA82958.1 sulfotransferase [Aureimonas sp. SA4125]